MIDTHAHLNLKDFRQDLPEVISGCQNLGIEVINVGIDRESSIQAIEIAETNKGFYATAGVHPNNQVRSFEGIDRLVGNEKVVAIGETGLDFHHSDRSENDLSAQIDLMIQHGQLSEKTGKPLVIHCRGAYRELISLLRREMNGAFGLVHAFSGSLDDARELLELGYFLGFGGLIFKMNLDEIIMSTPLDRILMETDSPYLSLSKEIKRNAPHLGLVPILERIAFIKKTSVQEVVSVTVDNAVRLFKLNEHGRVSTQ